ncbi:hypothetical protein G7Y89_g8845 [Cudoniella acicularis]|uniref:Uncharacterized protein n=1 Tax=Cudoniella acicularis TaxID=354080 RepID=A0A8H4RFV1_9HELO|nr:hypothetical protein G7Y89_g8845 [Cudoniella acicularis]
MPSDHATKIKQRLLATCDIEDTGVVMSPCSRCVKENRRCIVKKERSARYSEYDFEVLSIVAREAIAKSHCPLGQKTIVFTRRGNTLSTLYKARMHYSYAAAEVRPGRVTSRVTITWLRQTVADLRRHRITPSSTSRVNLTLDLDKGIPDTPITAVKVEVNEGLKVSVLDKYSKKRKDLKTFIL